MKNTIYIVITLLMISSSAKADSKEPFQWQIGEELTYSVSWAFIRLGTVRVVVEDSLEINSVKVHHVRFYIDSNPYIFFVDMHSTFDCYIDKHFRPVRYIASENVDDEFKKAVYDFNYTDSLFTVDVYNSANSKRISRNTLALQETTFDGISMIFLTRNRIDSLSSEDVLGFVDANLGRVQLNFKGPGNPIEIEAVDREIPTYFISGEILMEGIAGVTGPYKGWFAKDNSRPPLRAELKVFIGNVVVELESWKNWRPPQ